MADFYIPRYYTVDDVFGRFVSSLTPKIEAERRRLDLGPTVVPSQSYPESPDANPALATPPKSPVSTPDGDDPSILLQMSKPSSIGPYRFFIGLLVLFALILGLLLYDVAVCVTFPVWLFQLSPPELEIYFISQRIAYDLSSKLAEWVWSPLQFLFLVYVRIRRL